MKRIIIVLLSAVVLLTCGCNGSQETEEHVPAVIEDFDYDQYLVCPVEYPEANYYPDEKDFVKDGVMDTEGLSIAYSAFAGRMGDIETNREFNSRLVPFYQTMMQKLLLADKENNVFSPVNLFFNLTVLAAVTQGNASKEITDLLNLDPSAMAADYQRQWKDNTISGKVTLSYANSIWFSDSINLKEDNIEKIVSDYYVPVFTGETGTRDYTAAFQSWLNDNTGKMLGDYISALKLDRNVLMALASTIYYKTSWMEGYLAENNTSEVFHGANGNSDVVMMHKSVPMIYLKSDLFEGCVETTGTNNEMMIMLLPEKGVSFEQMFASRDFQDLIFGGELREDAVQYLRVNISLPKFDVSSRFELEEVLPEIGIKSIFGGQPDAFSPITDTSISVSKIEHACRVKADENGLEAAAYTVEIMIGGSLRQSVDLTFDRPFFFAVKTAFDNTLFFCGIVNQA